MNRLERGIGVDIDGDGDIGVRGISRVFFSAIYGGQKVRTEDVDPDGLVVTGAGEAATPQEQEQEAGVCLAVPCPAGLCSADPEERRAVVLHHPYVVLDLHIGGGKHCGRLLLPLAALAKGEPLTGMYRLAPPPGA